MRLALLIGCRPVLGKESSFVTLREGNWKLRYDNLKDTVLGIVAKGPVAIPQMDTTLVGPMDVKVSILMAGTERSINVWAESI